MKAIRIIQEEHRSLTAVLHGMQYLVRQIRFQLAEPDFALLRAILHYIDVVPERFHHPKEDRYLFRLLRERDPAAAIGADDDGDRRVGGASRAQRTDG